MSKYDVNKRYSERDALLLNIKIQSDILDELKKLVKIVRKGELEKRSPKKI